MCIQKRTETQMTFTEKLIEIETIVCPKDLPMHRKGSSKLLRESIRTSGLLTPIIVRQMGSGYVLIDGARRLAAWEKECPGQPIPSIVVVYKHSDRTQGTNFESLQEQRQCDALTINLARAKVPTKIVEEFVWKLQQKGMGYEAIASSIGYQESGVQKMIQRMKAKSEGEPAPTVHSRATISKIKRTRTMLRNIAKELELKDEADLQLFRQLQDFLQVHEELLVEKALQDASMHPAEQHNEEEMTEAR